MKAKRVMHSEGRAAATDSVPWRQRPHIRMRLAVEVSGVSSTKIYDLAKEERVRLVKLGGRTLVDVPSLIAFIETREPWTPGRRGEAGRAKLAENARRAWRS